MVAKAEQEADAKYLAMFNKFKAEDEEKFQRKEADIWKEVTKVRKKRKTAQATLN